MLSVLPKYEGFGVGGLLVKAAESYAKDLGCIRMVLDILIPVAGETPSKVQLMEWYTRLNYRFLHELPIEHAVYPEAKFLKMPCLFSVHEKKLLK
ncbi:MAG: GNAT family N-acetyltransferase [Flavobacteriales bacterium]|nr:GNAT family N-acetyltransferase [Flavobacteriales bacterium]